MTTKNKIDTKTGIDLGRVNHEVVRGYLEKFGLPTTGGDYQCVARLHDAMQLCKALKLGSCSSCRGKSHVDLSCCPFCGDGAVDESVVAARDGAVDETEPKVIAELKSLLEAKAAKDDATKAKDERTTKEVAASAAPGAQPLVAVPPGTGVRSRRAQKKADQLTIPAGDAPSNVPAVAATAADLDNSVKEFNRLFGTAAEAIYDAALVIFDVFERRLWMQRRGDNDQPLYTTFAQWVTAELTITYQYAYELTNLPKFFTREQVRQIGATKLTLSLRITEEERRKLIESGDLEKMSVRDVKAKITQAPSAEPKNPERAASMSRIAGSTPGGAPILETGNKLTTPGRKPNAHNKSKADLKEEGRKADAAEQRAPSIKPELITVVTCVLPTRIKFDMHARSKALGGPSTRARSLSEDPTGVIVCANGAKIRISLFVNGEGCIEGVALVESPTTSSDDESEE